MFLFIAVCMAFAGATIYRKYLHQKYGDEVPPGLNKLLIDAFVLYNDLYTKAQYRLNEACIAYPGFGKAVGMATSVYKHTTAYIGCYVAEPDYKNWIIHNRYNEDKDDIDALSEYFLEIGCYKISFTYLHTYMKICDEFGLSQLQVFDLFKTSYSHLCNKLAEKNNTDDETTILKYNNNYLCYVCNGAEKPFKFGRSSFKFLVIEYVCENELGDVCRLPINLHRNMYNDGNEILSSSFVLWYLNHQPEKYYYNRTYKLNCIKNDGDYVTLGFKDYIKICKNTYEKITV